MSAGNVSTRSAPAPSHVLILTWRPPQADDLSLATMSPIILASPAASMTQTTLPLVQSGRPMRAAAAASAVSEQERDRRVRAVHLASCLRYSELPRQHRRLDQRFQVREPVLGRSRRPPEIESIDPRVRISAAARSVRFAPSDVGTGLSFGTGPVEVCSDEAGFE